MAITNIRVEKHQAEQTASLLKRFQKKVQESGILPKVRSIRYAERKLSDLKIKRAKLKKIAGAIAYAKLKRLGISLEKKKK